MAQVQTRQVAKYVDRLRTRIEGACRNGDISEADRDALIEFSDELFLLSTKYSDHRHEKLLRHCTIVAEEVGGLAAALEEKDATELILRWINRTYDNEETNSDYRTAIRVFGKRVAPDDDGDAPPSIDWIPSGTSSTYDPKPNPAKMLDWHDETVPMVEATSTAQQAAAVALQFDAGLRGGEFKDLSTDQFTDHRFGLQVTVHGKQGQRTVTLIPSVPYVQKWLEDHPGEKGDPMWCKDTDPTRSVSDRTIYNWFERAAELVDVDKPTTLTNFRKSSASFMASRGMSQAHLEQRYGWVRGSKVASRYVAIFGKEHEAETAKAWGKEIQEEDEADPMDPITCPRCDKHTPRERDLCVWCGQALEPGAAELADELENWIVDRMSESADPEQRNRYRRTWQEVREDPEARAEAVDQLAEQIGTEN